MIVHIVGARPQFIKLMPLYEVLKKKGAPQLIIHTGQHWEEGMSNVFFREFDIYPDQIFDWEPLLKNQIQRFFGDKINLVDSGDAVGYEVKTFISKKIANKIAGKKENIFSIQFHQSYSYEEFVIVYKPNSEGNFAIQQGSLIQFCE